METPLISARGTDQPPLRVRPTAEDLLCLDVGRADYLTPLVGLVGDQLGRCGGGEDEGGATQLGKSLRDPWFGKGCIDCLIQAANRDGWRALGCGDAEEGARLVASQLLAEARDLLQCVGAVR